MQSEFDLVNVIHVIVSSLIPVIGLNFAKFVIH